MAWSNILVTRMLMRDLFAVANLVTAVKTDLYTHMIMNTFPVAAAEYFTRF